MTTEIIDQEFKKAKDYAYKLLEARSRSEKEILDRLSKKEFKDKTIELVISDFKEIGLLNDRDFAQKWIEDRLRNAYGRHRITRELCEKGIADETIEYELSTAMANFNEQEIITELARKKASCFQGIDNIKIKQRVYRYLIYRGFDPGITNIVVSQL